MKTIPVTPELLQILADAKQDSLEFIRCCEKDLVNYTEQSSVHNALVLGIERRRQLLAITKDLLERYK